MTISAFAARAAKETLTPFSYEPEELSTHDVEIAISHSGICHSDVHLIDDDWGVSRYPLVPGHEIVGTVTGVGSESKLRVGQRVGVGWQRSACLSCDLCARGQREPLRVAEGDLRGRPRRLRGSHPHRRTLCVSASGEARQRGGGAPLVRRRDGVRAHSPLSGGREARRWASSASVGSGTWRSASSTRSVARSPSSRRRRRSATRQGGSAPTTRPPRPTPESFESTKDASTSCSRRRRRSSTGPPISRCFGRTGCSAWSARRPASFSFPRARSSAVNAPSAGATLGAAGRSKTPWPSRPSTGSARRWRALPLAEVNRGDRSRAEERGALSDGARQLDGREHHRALVVAIPLEPRLHLARAAPCRCASAGWRARRSSTTLGRSARASPRCAATSSLGACRRSPRARGTRPTSSPWTRCGKPTTTSLPDDLGHGRREPPLDGQRAVLLGAADDDLLDPSR